MAQIYASLVQTWVRDIVAVAGVFPPDPDWANNAVPVPTDRLPSRFTAFPRFKAGS